MAKKAPFLFLFIQILSVTFTRCEHFGLPQKPYGGDDDDDDSTEVFPPEISGLNPTYGSNNGGGEVTIYGSSFTDESDILVEFGKNEATVLSSDSGTIRCLTPSTSRTGRVDVKVTTSGGEATLPDGFRYYEDGTGQYGALVNFILQEYVSPLFEDPSPYSFAVGYFHEPVDSGLYDYLVEESCAIDPDMSGTISPLDAGPEIILSSGGTSVILPKVDYYYLLEDTNPSYFIKDAAYSLNFSGSEDLPGLTIDSALVTPPDFSVIEPDIASRNPVSFQTSMGVTFTWSPAGSGDSNMFLFLLVWNQDLTDIETTLVCRAFDDGSFYISSSHTSPLPGNRYVSVLAAKVQFSNQTLPYDNSYIEGTGELSKVGIIMTR